MTLLKGITPKPAQVKAAYREAFAPAIEDGAGRDGRISRREAERMAERSDSGSLVGDNVLNYLDRTGQKSVSARKFIGVVADYAERESEKAAGPNQRLSLVEIRNLPADLVADLQHLRGKDDLQPFAPTVEFEENAMYALIYPEQGKGWQASRVVDAGTLRDTPAGVELEGLSDVGDWQPAAQEALTHLWDIHLRHREWQGKVDVGDNGSLRMGPVVDAETGEQGLLVHWNDVDDGSHAFFYGKNDEEEWTRSNSVFLN